MPDETTAATPATISVWQDDPGSGAPTIQVTSPNITGGPLATQISGTAPQPKVYPTGTPDFRYWTAAEILRRAAAFWGALLPAGAQWHPGATLPVVLDFGVDLNAYYDRQGLKFFHGDGGGGVVFSGESPDVVAHELGHAVLDAIKPQLWGAASLEAAAFHEAFGDMSGILAGLQLQSLRVSVLTETHGQLQLNSRLSRMAEQLGAAIRIRHPASVDPDSLRNAANRFTYVDPMTLPSSAPASQLSSESHSFSRVFTGAFLEALAGLLVASAATPGAPTEQELARVSREMGRILVGGIRRASVVANFYAQVASAMVVEGGAVNAAYPAVLRRVFTRRGILSLQSASSAMSLVGDAQVAAFAADVGGSELTEVAFSGQLFGLGDTPLFVQAASQPRSVAATAVGIAFGSHESTSSEAAARAFVDRLLTGDKVDRAAIEEDDAYALHRRPYQSHRLVKRTNGLALERVHFDCGLCAAQ